MCVHTSGSQRSTTDIVPQALSALVFVTGFLTGQELADWTSLLLSDPRHPLVSVPPMLG